MTASLICSWWFPEQRKAMNVDFVTEEGEMSTFIRDVAAHIEVIDGGAALWRGLYGDMERAWLLERQKRIEMEDLLGWKEMATA